MLNTSQIALAWELFEHGIPKSRIAADLGKTRETIHTDITCQKWTYL